MEISALEKIRRAEMESKRKIEEARAQAKKIVEDALREKKEHIERTRKHCAEKTAALLEEANFSGRKEAADMKEKTAEEIAALKTRTAPLIEKAVTKVLGRLKSG